MKIKDVLVTLFLGIITVLLTAIIYDVYIENEKVYIENEKNNKPTDRDQFNDMYLIEQKDVIRRQAELLKKQNETIRKNDALIQQSIKTIKQYEEELQNYQQVKNQYGQINRDKKHMLKKNNAIVGKNEKFPFEEEHQNVDNYKNMHYASKSDISDNITNEVLVANKYIIKNIFNEKEHFFITNSLIRLYKIKGLTKKKNELLINTITKMNDFLIKNSIEKSKEIDRKLAAYNLKNVYNYMVNSYSTKAQLKLIDDVIKKIEIEIKENHEK